MLYAEWTPKFHTISFDSDGGSAVGVQRIAHDGRVSRPGDPTREGFMFAGWYAGGSSYDFDALVTSDLTLKARWIAKTEQWTVVFDSDNGTAVESQTIADGGRATEPSSPTREGYTFDGWYAGSGGGAPYQFGSPVTGNLTLHAKWTPITHDVTFDGNGEGVSRVPPGQPVAHGGWLVRPPDPYRAGFTFAGWTLNGQSYDFNSVVMGDFELKAQWVNQQPWTLAFDSNGGTAIASQSVQDGKQATRPADPTREGYAFGGWYASLDDDAPYQFDRPVAGNFTLHAKWAPKSYDVAFDSSGGSTVASQTVAHGEKAARPANPTRAGYVFAGWLSNESPYDFDAPVTGRLELKARWGTPQEWTVAFDSDGGANVDAQFVKDGDAAHKPEAPVREGYEFDGWFESADLTGDAYDFGKPVEDHLVLYAKWMPKTYTVTFDSDGGSGAEPQTVAHGEKAVRPVDPTRENYTFAGWAASGASYDFGSTVTGDLELKARWAKIQQWLVAFDSDGGTAVASQSVQDGKQATKPADPTREGYTFGGWYASSDDDAPYQFGSPVTGNLVLRAKWSPISHDVTFDGNGEGAANVPGGQSVKHGDKVVLPANPTREGYVFAGWRAGDDYYDFNAPVTNDLTLQAQRSEIQKWTVSFVSFDGSSVDVQNVAGGKQAARPDDPTLEGHTFGGWFESAACEGDPYNFGGAVNDDLILFAKWTPKTCKVTFDSDGGGEVAEQEIAYGSKAEAPSGPIRENYRFNGWYAKGSEESYDFNVPVTDDVNLTARWVIDTYSVTFNSSGGSAIESQEVACGSKAVDPGVPSIESYLFDGWYEDGSEEPYDFDTPVTCDVSLVARWHLDTRAVTFDDEGTVVGKQDVPYGGHAEPMALMKDDNTFAGWYADEALDVEYDFSAPISEDVAIYAKWEAKSFRVTFDANGGSPTPGEQSVAFGENASEPADQPSRENLSFGGWYVQITDEALDDAAAGEIRDNPVLSRDRWVTDDNHLLALYDFAYPIENDIALHARWMPGDSTVSFDVNTVLFVDEAGNVVHEQKVQSGNAPIEIEGGSDGGYRFDGWFADAARSVKYDFSQPIHSDTTIYGTWTQQLLTVTFDSNGGSAVSPAVQQVAYESLATDPGNPVWDGHGFLGWYEDASDELTLDDLAKLKAELNEAIATEGIDSEIKAELEQYRQEIEKRVAVIDGKVKVAYNPSSDHVYSDMTVQAQWSEEGSLATEIVLGDGVPQIVAPNLNEVARALVTPEEIKQGAVVRLKITLIDSAEALPADEAALRSKLKEAGASDRMWLDISLYKVVGGVETKLRSTPSPLKLALDIPEDMRADGRTFYLLRAHDGAADVVSTGTGATLSGETDRFSTYVLGSKDAQQGPAAKGGAAKTGSGLAKTGDALAPWIVPSLGMLGLLAFGALLLAARKRE